MHYLTRVHVDALERLAGKPLPLPVPEVMPTRRGGAVEAWKVATVRAAIIAAWITGR